MLLFFSDAGDYLPIPSSLTGCLEELDMKRGVKNILPVILDTSFTASMFRHVYDMALPTMIVSTVNIVTSLQAKRDALNSKVQEGLKGHFSLDARDANVFLDMAILVTISSSRLNPSRSIFIFKEVPGQLIPLLPRQTRCSAFFPFPSL